LSGKRGERQDLTLPSRSALHERPKPFAVHLWIPAWSRSSVAVHLGSLLWPKPPQFSGGSVLWPKPLQFSGGSLLGPKPVAVLRWVLFQAEACPIVPWIVASTEVSATFRWIAVRTEILPVLLRKDVLAEASSSLLWIPAETEVFGRFPGSRLGPKPFAVHRSGPRFGPKPWRFACPESPCRPKPIGIFRPESLSAGAGTLPGWLPVEAEALAARLRSAVPAVADRFLRVGSPCGRSPSGSPLAVP
jgi:hypothetical protein